MKRTCIRLLALCIAAVLLCAAAVAEISPQQYDKLVGNARKELIQGLINAESQEAFNALLDGLTDQQLEELAKHIKDDEMEAITQTLVSFYEPPQTVSYTRAGRFHPPVDVSTQVREANGAKKAPLRLAAAQDGEGNGTGRTDNEGVVTSKTATPNEDGTYTIRMESYVTGATTTTVEETTTPVDIVLVLDQSGSMTDSFGNTTRQAAMKTAVNSFIDAVASQYSTSGDHRMAIVTYGSNASNLRGWTTVDTTGTASLHTAIDGLPNSPSGATNAGAGMANAAALMGSGYSYNGTNTTRSKVVVMFTDGVPTTSSRFSTSVANTALGHANTLKNSGVTVYTIGIFQGADVGQLYGNTGFEENSNGNVGSHWSNYEGIFVGDVSTTDVPAGNRFLNYLSGNFGGVTNIGLKEYEKKFLFWGQAGWEITANATRTASGYYLTAENLDTLGNIFTEISENIQTGGATVTLGSSTVLKDIVSLYFQLPEGASDIVVKTADCDSFNGDTPVWTNEQVATGLTAAVSGNEITVTGFDYSEHWVGKDTNTQQVHDKAQKLIVEITIEPKEGFLGGNNIPTNGEGSGLYTTGNVPVEYFEGPTVDMDVPTATVTLNNWNVYLGTTLTQAQLLNGATLNFGTDELTLLPTEEYFADKPYTQAEMEETLAAEGFTLAQWWTTQGDLANGIPGGNFGLDEWKTEFVEIEMGVPTGTGALTGNSNYSVWFTVKAKDAPAQAQMLLMAVNPTEPTPAGATTEEGTITVFKPHVSFADGTVDYKSQISNTGYISNKMPVSFAPAEEVAWLSDGNVNANEVTMLGTAPAITYEYAPASGVTGDIVTATDTVPVNVTVKAGGAVVTDSAVFAHVCTVDGVECDATSRQSNQIILHVINLTGKLQVNNATNVPVSVHVQSTDGSTSFTLILPGFNSSSKTLELPVGTWTVKEEDLAWRSWLGLDAETEVTVVSGDTAITGIYHGDTSTKWLDGDNCATNVFNTVTVGGGQQ